MDYKDGHSLGLKIIEENLENTTDKIIYYISKCSISYENFNNFYIYAKFLKKSKFIKEEKLEKFIEILINSNVIYVDNQYKYIRIIEELKGMLSKKRSLKKHH